MMGVKNSEIRFKCEKELVTKARGLYDSINQFSDLKLTAFHKNVFELGLKNLQNQILDDAKFKKIF